MSPYTKYQESQTLTADPGTLVLMLYDGAITSLRKAHQIMQQPSYSRQEFSELVVKGQEIVMELVASLNFEAGEIARNLWRLYDYMGWQIRQADLQKDPRRLEDVLGHLTSLRGTWAQIVEQQSPAHLMPVPAAQPTATRGFVVA